MLPWSAAIPGGRADVKYFIIAHFIYYFFYLCIWDLHEYFLDLRIDSFFYFILFFCKCVYFM